MDGVEAPPAAIPITGDDPANALRFEDLTIDDDLPLLDRVVRYCRSGIALQRLVHVKMLAETAETVGPAATIQTLVPLLHPLVTDAESIIRQHLATQLLPFSIACMVEGIGPLQNSVNYFMEHPEAEKTYHEDGYDIVTSTIVTHLNSFIMDKDADVRRAASESLAGLAMQIRREDIGVIILPIPLRLAHPNAKLVKKGDPEALQEELRITAANLLAELSGATESGKMPLDLVHKHVMPCTLSLAKDTSFRVRRAAAQALPRVLGGTSLKDTKEHIMPVFDALSRDDMYRVRKSTGECLVDMSRSLMILARKVTREERAELSALRRSWLIPIATRLLDDPNKFVRHGMMQFLGPFMASFYPLDQDEALGVVLPGLSDAAEGPLPMDGSHFGIGTQFFPHATSMVSRLNASTSTNTSAPTPTPASFHTPSPTLSAMEKLQQQLPPFLRANSMSISSLRSVIAHRQRSPPDPDDVSAVASQLLKHFVFLSKVSTGDENTDAEMRVYCAYSYPAVVLLLGPENWEGMLKDCFLTLINPNYDNDGAEDALPPLPVKRCLASSLHTVAHILGPELAQSDILPVFREFFFRDSDDSVRLNVIRNFPWLMSLFPRSVKCEYLSVWYDIVKGEDLLGAHKRSATNPMLLNWRQRDYVSRSMSEMLGLVDPLDVQQFLWPVLQMLLRDTVSLVREDAKWSIPLLLRAYCAENIGNSDKKSGFPSTVDKRWSADVCQDVVAWLKDAILSSTFLSSSTRSSKSSNGDNGKGGNFSQRQLYCRICAAIGIAIGVSDVSQSDSQPFDENPVPLDESGHGVRARNESYTPYQLLTSEERKHLRRLLVYDLLPPALEMKDDKVTNVRLTLMKCLQLMPDDIRKLATVSAVLQEIEDEVETWEAVYGNESAKMMSVAHSANGPVMVSVSSSGATSSFETSNQVVVEATFHDSLSSTGSTKDLSGSTKHRKTRQTSEEDAPVDVDTLDRVPKT